MIKIKNIYYMLSYAFRALQEREYALMAVEEFENIHELLAAIFITGVRGQIKRGLERDYCMTEDLLLSPRGRILLHECIRQQGKGNKKLACAYDEFSENTAMNQILKTTGQLLLKDAMVSSKRRGELKRCMSYFEKVSSVNPYRIQWNLWNYHRNNATYRLLMSVCYMILHDLLLSHGKGEFLIREYMDDQKGFQLFEKFVLKYYQRHYPQLCPSASYIRWNTGSEAQELLPVMKTDITLKYNQKVLIIDTKFYEHILAKGIYANKNSPRSAHLYQIHAYVKNMDVARTGAVKGIILYAKTEECEDINKDFNIGGNLIGIRTVNLNTDFSQIREQLNELAETLIIK